MLVAERHEANGTRTLAVSDQEDSFWRLLD